MHFFALDASNEVDCLFSPLPLVYIYRFTNKMHETLRHHEKNVVACASKNNRKIMTNTALMLGSFLILGKNMGYDDLVAAFKPVSTLFLTYSDWSSTMSDGALTVMDCWKALYHAKSLFWIDLSNDIHFQKNDSTDSKRLDIDECIHYADPANANLHILLPWKLLFISSPADLPDGRQWMDDGARRHFSSAFYADLLGEFDVVLVLCLENCSYDCGPFTRRGIGVEELHLRTDSPDLLRAADRFLSLLRAAPGAVALHGHADALRLAGALVSAHMTSRLGFGAADAAAWLRMVCPALLVPAEHRDLAALRDGADLLLAGEPAAAAAAFLRCLSAPQTPPAGRGGEADSDRTRGGAARPGLLRVPLERPASLPDVIL
jgi:hypothetical protein